MKTIKILLAFFLVVANTVAQNQISGLIAHFDFDNNLTSSNNMHVLKSNTNQKVNFSSGLAGNGVELDGSYVLINESIINTTKDLENFSVAWWEYRSGTDTAELPTSIEIEASFFYRLNNNNDQNSRFEIGCNANDKNLTLQTLKNNLGIWHYHVISKSGNEMNYYIDGDINVSGWDANNNEMNKTSSKFIVGGGTVNGAFSKSKMMVGIIDELMIFDKTLTPNEVFFLKNSYRSNTNLSFNQSFNNGYAGK